MREEGRERGREGGGEGGLGSVKQIKSKAVTLGRRWERWERGRESRAYRVYTGQYLAEGAVVLVVDVVLFARLLDDGDELIELRKVRRRKGRREGGRRFM